MFFDLKTGQSILKYGIDFKDHFSFITGLSYLYHHYLYDIVLYFIFNFFGYDGIFFLFLGMFVLFGVIVFIINKKYTSNNLASLLVTLFTIFSCSYAFQSRVQSITFILFFLEVYFINKLFEEGKIINFIYLILLSILIANLHMPIWIFTLVLYLPFMFEYLIYKKFNNNVNKLTNKLIIRHPKNEKLFIITFITLIFTGCLIINLLVNLLTLLLN